MVVVVVVVVVVEWLIILKEQLLLEGLTFAIFFVRRFSFRKKCVFVSRPMKIVTFLQKTVRPQNWLLIFFWKETHSETQSWKPSRISTKSYNNNGKSWKSSRILRVKPNFFIFLMFHHFSSFLFSHLNIFSLFF